MLSMPPLSPINAAVALDRDLACWISHVVIRRPVDGVSARDCFGGLVHATLPTELCNQLHLSNVFVRHS